MSMENEKPDIAHDPEASGFDENRLDAVVDAALQGINWRLASINLWSLIATMNYGFAAACIGSTLGQPQFYARFPDLLTKANGTDIIGAIVGLQSVGGAIGVILVCWVQDKWGRKSGFFISMLVSLLGAALAAGSVNVTMLIIARLLSGIGVWAGVLCAIVYQSEMAPTTVRGLLGGSVGVGITFGYVIAAWLSVGFFYLHDDINWRIPLILQIVAPFAVLAGLPFMPESPRWLAFNGRREESLKVLERIHSYSADVHHLVAKEEHYQICRQVDVDLSFSASWATMVSSKYRRRSFVAALVLFANQATGIQIVTNYGPTVYATLGLTGGSPLIVAGGWYIMAWLSDCFWCLWVDRVGRRPLIVYGTLFAALMLSIMVAMIAKYVGPDVTNLAGQRATVFMFFIFVFAYSTCEPAMYLYISEIFPNHVRVKGIAIGLASLNITSVWGTMSQPHGVAAIGWKYYLVFVVLTYVNSAILYFTIVETKGVPLEEIAGLFGDEGEVAVHVHAEK